MYISIYSILVFVVVKLMQISSLFLSNGNRELNTERKFYSHLLTNASLDLSFFFSNKRLSPRRQRECCFLFVLELLGNQSYRHEEDRIDRRTFSWFCYSAHQLIACGTCWTRERERGRGGK